MSVNALILLIPPKMTVNDLLTINKKKDFIKFLFTSIHFRCIIALVFDDDNITPDSPDGESYKLLTLDA